MPQNRRSRRPSSPQSTAMLSSSKIAKGKEQPARYQIRHLTQRQSQRVRDRLILEPRRVYRHVPARKRESCIESDRFNSPKCDDDFECSTRIKCHKKSIKPVPSDFYRSLSPSSVLANFANKDPHMLRRLLHLKNLSNSNPQNGQKTISTYIQNTHSPTSDFQTLVLVVVREQLRKELAHLEEVTNEATYPFEMTNMRLKSFIANTEDIMDHWKSAMLGEGMRIIDESLESRQTSWVMPGSKGELPMMVDEEKLLSLPPDKPEISKSQVASQYIQAQRGQQTNEQEEFARLFQSEMLKAEIAATTLQDMFDRIVACNKHVVQKLIEIEFIEKKRETMQPVSNYFKQLKVSDVRIVQESMTQNLGDAVEQGRSFVKILIGSIMDDLHAAHESRHFEPMRIVVMKSE